MNSLKGSFKNKPILKLYLLLDSLCTPIIFEFDRFNIGAPEEPKSAEHKCSKL